MTTVLIVRGPRPWPAELLASLAGEGHLSIWIDDIRLVPFFVLAGGVSAVLVDARSLEILDALTLRRCREHSPSTALVAIALDAAAATVKHALDSGATAFLSWPAPPHALARAMRSGKP